MQGSTVAARRPNLQPLPDPEPDFVAELDDPKQRSRGLWVPGRTGAGAAIAALRAERDADRRGVARA